MNSLNRGIIEALSIQCPEHLDGCEFVEVAPYLKKYIVAQDAFIESIIWRKPTAFSEDKKNTLKYINNIIIRKESRLHDVLNALLAVALIPNHPFNADFLHKNLSKFSMPKRDFWWSTYLHYQYRQKGSVDRLVEWGWSVQDKTHINDECIRLCSVALCWFLTTSNRFLRDRATKALVAILTNRLSVVLKLLKQFKSVNDPYVSERLYAIAYGCAIRSRKDKKGIEYLSKWVYNEIFKNNKPPVHVLLRDYARGIIEVSLNEKIEIAIDKQKIAPPFSSDWPIRVPSKKFLENKYYSKDSKTEKMKFLSIWSSVMGEIGDFRNYVLNPAVNHWSGRRLNSNVINRKNLFNVFKNNLNELQKELLEKATNPFFDRNLLNISISVSYMLSNEEKIEEEKLKLQKEKKKAYSKFESSLSQEEKEFFLKEIKPFLVNHGYICDPLEGFDTNLAQRWIFNRVVQLGWRQEMHGQFDKEINNYFVNMSENKPERIGKKYQWIAFHELLARISDNFEFKEKNWLNQRVKFEGPWQLSIRDIDPTCILKEISDEKPKEIPVFDKFIEDQYNAGNKEISCFKWLKEIQDLPDPKHIIEYTDEQGNNWLMIDGYIGWQEETPPEQEKYNLPTRRLWYMLKSYLVHAKDKNEIFKWAKQQNFKGRWMPESHDFYNVYLGEYYWAPAFLYYYTSIYQDEGWTDKIRDNSIPSRILVTDEHYNSSGLSRDCSTNESINIKLSAKFIVDKMNLDQTLTDGKFFDKNGELITFDPGIFDANMSRCIFIRKNKMIHFLKNNGYALFWTLLGEKNIIGGYSIGRQFGRLEINGAYTLSKKNKIIGVKKSFFENFS